MYATRSHQTQARRLVAERYENGAYLEAVPDWHASDAEWKADELLRLLRRHALVPRTVADVGCGTGGVLRVLQRRLPVTTRFYGYDPSPQALALAQRHKNARLSFQPLAALEEAPAPFDLLLSLDVLEHVPDYLGYLARLQPLARRFLFHIPLDVSVHTVLRGSRHELGMRRRYGHLHYFTAATARATLEDTGYRIDDAVYTWDHEADTLPPVAPGPLGRLRYPLRCAAYALERIAQRLSPDLTARLRPAYNLLVLASAGTAPRA